MKYFLISLSLLLSSCAGMVVVDHPKPGEPQRYRYLLGEDGSLLAQIDNKEHTTQFFESCEKQAFPRLIYLSDVVSAQLESCKNPPKPPAQKPTDPKKK
jgi:hypothetical protein